MELYVCDISNKCGNKAKNFVLKVMLLCAAISRTKSKESIAFILLSVLPSSSGN
jgi:hypothetical protein